MIKILLVGVVAALHFYFLILEMFLWSKPTGRKVFRMSIEQAEQTRVLAANQGLYNGFLAAGLVWSMLAGDPNIAKQLAIFFLCCVLVAALYGAYSVGRKILFIQGGPALLALVATLIMN